MAKTIIQRLNLTGDDDFLVFIIKTQIDHLWKINKWVPSAFKIFRNLNEFSFIKERGFLGYQIIGFFPLIVVQYWNSVEQLEFHLKEMDNNSYPNWKATVQRVNNNGGVTILNEIYNVKAGKVGKNSTIKTIFEQQDYSYNLQFAPKFENSNY